MLKAGSSRLWYWLSLVLKGLDMELTRIWDVESRREMTQIRRGFKSCSLEIGNLTVKSCGDSHVSTTPPCWCEFRVHHRAGKGMLLGYLEPALQPCEVASENPSAPRVELLPTRNP